MLRFFVKPENLTQTKYLVEYDVDMVWAFSCEGILWNFDDFGEIRRFRRVKRRDFSFGKLPIPELLNAAVCLRFLVCIVPKRKWCSCCRERKMQLIRPNLGSLGDIWMCLGLDSHIRKPQQVKIEAHCVRKCPMVRSFGLQQELSLSKVQETKKNSPP